MLLDGSEHMTPRQGQAVLVEDDRIAAVLPEQDCSLEGFEVIGFSIMESWFICFFSIKFLYSLSRSSFFFSEIALGISKSSIRLLELSCSRLAPVL